MPNLEIDHTDREILHHLQQDGRLTNAELAERVHLSPSPCLRRVRNLEERGIIRRYATLLDPRKVGLPISVFVSVSLKSQDRVAIQEFEAHVETYPEVMECYLMTGSSDYLLRVVVTDLDAYEAFLSAKLTTIGSVANIQSSFSLKQVVYRTELPIPH